MLPKNIIVCADGTGNKGGYTPDSNVYRVYKAVDKSFIGECGDGCKVSEQIIFYDNGVGTATNKYLRVLGGAFGFGFERNVCDLYKYLARNYVPDDRIYFFGFSRGASTVRACNGMISKCGLAKGRGLRNRDLDKLVSKAFEAYKCVKKNPAKAEAFKNSDESDGNVPVHFMGIWDTVVALGFPKRTDITGLLSWLLDKLFMSLEKVLDFLWPHSFYYYRLTDNVHYACQALAIDDERTAFWPYVWSEKDIDGDPDNDRTPDNVEQVWFAGMHSNVGGGYRRAGMAGVPLGWVMRRAIRHGVVFNEDAMELVHDQSHIHGRMYNSRDGIAMLYRYHPREIEKLCQDKLQGNIRIHCSVVERLNHRTANYVPGYIPATFDVVDSEVPANVQTRNPGKHKNWARTRQLIDKWVLYRKRLYGLMLSTVLTIVSFALYFWVTPPDRWGRSGLFGHLADILDYITPQFFEGLIEIIVVQRPYLFIGAVILLVFYVLVRRILYRKTVDACETLRHYIIHEQPDRQAPVAEEDSA